MHLSSTETCVEAISRSRMDETITILKKMILLSSQRARTTHTRELGGWRGSSSDSNWLASYHGANPSTYFHLIIHLEHYELLMFCCVRFAVFGYSMSEKRIRICTYVTREAFHSVTFINFLHLVSICFQRMLQIVLINLAARNMGNQKTANFADEIPIRINKDIRAVVAAAPDSEWKLHSTSLISVINNKHYVG